MKDINFDLSRIAQSFDEMAETAIGDDADVYKCQLCRDCGYVIVEGRAYQCNCRRNRILQERKAHIGLSPRLQRMNFSSFDLQCYPEDLFIGKSSYRQLAALARDAALGFVRTQKNHNSPRGLLLEGEVGCGKTHLAAAITNALIELEEDALFLVVPEFLDQLRFSYRRENEGLDEAEIIRRAYRAQVLVLDDLGAHNYTDWVCNKLFTIINHRYNRNLPCIITTNLSFVDLESKLGDRTASRLYEMCDHMMMAAGDLRLSNKRV